MHYESHRFSNGLRIIHLQNNSPVSYCGFTVGAGTRDEASNEFGMAHFIEHMLFKGTKKRRAWHILNRMENVGGELNAYTTKEETVLYSVCLADDTERAVELLSDIVFNSQFPEPEIEKEREVVLDEINSYKDNPSEQIFDDFENLLFAGHEIGHNILGVADSLNTFNQTSCKRFFQQFYQPENMVFFYYGKIPFSKIVRITSKYMQPESIFPGTQQKRTAPSMIASDQIEMDKGLHQAHVMIGSRGYSLHDKNRIGLYFLNNLLGGPGMNSRLNLNLREKHGLVYTVESSLTSYSDTGILSIYFGCDHETKDKCLKLTYKELKKLREEKLTTAQLTAAQKQLKGQLGISGDHSENVALGMGKSFLHFNRYDQLEEVYRKIDAITSGQVLEIANDVLDEKKLFRLVFQ